jgi:hypothetical protein
MARLTEIHRQQLRLTQITNSERALSVMMISKMLLLVLESSTHSTWNMVSQMMVLTLWSHFVPGPMHGLREMNRQTDSSSYLYNLVISTISSTWMLWIWKFSASSSCKLLESLICFSLIILYRNVLFASHHLYHVFCLLTLCFSRALQLASLILNAFARQHCTARKTLLLSLCPICAMPSNYMLKRISCLPLISVRTIGLQWWSFRSSGTSTILIHWRQLRLILTLSNKLLMSKLFLS